MTASFFTIDDHDIAFLKDQWDDLVSFYISDRFIKENLFEILKTRYSEKSRFYHNLSHVKALLHLFESHPAKIQKPAAIRFSIWFHDVVYDTKRNDNEEESANMASETLGQLQVGIETIELVRESILATKGHSGAHLPEDAKLFLDMDLAILGMKEETYTQYSKAVRAEYSWVPESQYRKSRRNILKSFIDRERIYFTDKMKAKFEEQARKNIHGEIESLGDQ